MSKFDWQNQSVAVIKGVVEFSNAIETEEIKRFYKSSKIKDALAHKIPKSYTVLKTNKT